MFVYLSQGLQVEQIFLWTPGKLDASKTFQETQINWFPRNIEKCLVGEKHVYVWADRQKYYGEVLNNWLIFMKCKWTSIINNLKIKTDDSKIQRSLFSVAMFPWNGDMNSNKVIQFWILRPFGYLLFHGYPHWMKPTSEIYG